MQVEEKRSRDNHAWTWNTTLRIVYHPRGCQICMEYGRHVMEAELTKDEEYLATYQERKEEMDFWKSRANRYLDELEDAEAEVRRLQARVTELEQRVEAGRDYGDSRKSKWARYGSPFGGESGVESPMVPTPTSGTPVPPLQESTGYARALREPPPAIIQEDVMMEVEDARSFPALPEPGQPTMSMGNVTRLQ